MNKNINFFDENGKLLPLNILQEQLNFIYNDYLSDKKESVLDSFVDPELQVNSEEVINTFSFMDRTLYLCSEVTHEHAIIFTNIVRFWNKVDEIDKIPEEKRQPIKIYIDSPGGDLDATFSIIDSILLSKTPIWTITIGSGDSGGFFIGICGHKRIGYQHSSYLFHEGNCHNAGDAHKYLQHAEFYKKKLSMLEEITLQRTKITELEYKEHKKDDLWLTAEEALNKGIIDEIATELI